MKHWVTNFAFAVSDSGLHIAVAWVRFVKKSQICVRKIWSGSHMGKKWGTGLHSLHSGETVIIILSTRWRNTVTFNKSPLFNLLVFSEAAALCHVWFLMFDKPVVTRSAPAWSVTGWTAWRSRWPLCRWRGRRCRCLFAWTAHRISPCRPPVPPSSRRAGRGRKKHFKSFLGRGRHGLIQR